MVDMSFFFWLFFEDYYCKFVEELEEFVVGFYVDYFDMDEVCWLLVREMGDVGWLKLIGVEDGVLLDVRMFCFFCEILVCYDGLVDFVFVM